MSAALKPELKITAQIIGSGPPGKNGEPGHAPIKGVDYFDGEKGDPGYTPVKGVDYFDGLKGDKGDPLAVTKNPSTLLVSGWVGTEPPYIQSVAAPGVMPGKSVNYYPVFSETFATALLQDDAFNEVTTIVVTPDIITFKCFYSKPLIDIPLMIEWV